MRSLLRLCPFLRPYRIKAALALILLFLIVGADLAIPRLTQRIIDQGIILHNLRVVIATSLFMVGASSANMLIIFRSEDDIWKTLSALAAADFITLATTRAEGDG